MSKNEERLKNAQKIASYSPDPSTKVGASVYDGDRMVNFGYNDFPPNVIASEERLNNREEKYPRIVHAEMWAIINQNVEGMTMYVTHFPCSQCCGALIVAGIKEVVTYKPDEDYMSRWKDSVEMSSSMLQEAGVKLTLVDLSNDQTSGKVKGS